MKTKLAIACAILFTLASPARAHRLDEYLQATTISLEKSAVHIQIRLTPGVAVYNKVIASIDINADGTISEAEEHSYAKQVLHDLSLSIDGEPLNLWLISSQFPTLPEMRKGVGEINLSFDATLSSGPGRHKLVFENRHQRQIAAYLVNCLVPEDPDLQVTAQNRNYLQSSYQLDYSQASSGFTTPLHGPVMGWLFAVIALSAVLGLWLRQRIGATTHKGDGY